MIPPLVTIAPDMNNTVVPWEEWIVFFFRTYTSYEEATIQTVSLIIHEIDDYFILKTIFLNQREFSS